MVKLKNVKHTLLLIPFLWVSGLCALEISQRISDAPPKADPSADQEWLYMVNYDGEEVGYDRVASRNLDSGIQVTEVRDMRVPSFWGETVILSRNIEQYDKANRITQGEYVTLYDQYLLVSHLVPASRGLMKHTFQWFELEGEMLVELTDVWNQATHITITEQLAWPEILNKIKHMKAQESHASYVDPNQFDMTMTALSLTLPTMLSNTNRRAVRVFDPDAEDESLFYELSVELVQDNLAKSSVPQANSQHQNPQTSNLPQPKLQNIKVTYSQGGTSHYLYDMSTQPATLIRMIDESGDDKFELSLKR